MIESNEQRHILGMPEEMRCSNDDSITWIVPELQGQYQTYIPGLEGMSTPSSLILCIPDWLFIVEDDSFMHFFKEFPLEGNQTPMFLSSTGSIPVRVTSLVEHGEDLLKAINFLDAQR